MVGSYHCTSVSEIVPHGYPSRLWTDKGTEFYNQQLKAVLTANNVMLYSTENEEKSSVVERWDRTMKNIMWYFTQKYIDVLPRMVEKYNNTCHRSSAGQITITIDNQDQFLHLHISYLLIEGNVLKADDTRYADVNLIALTNNVPIFQFEVSIDWRDGGICQLSCSCYNTPWFSELLINIYQRMWTGTRLISTPMQLLIILDFIHDRGI